ncbi:MAG TPA: transglutaminase family protein [Acidothermaceae bacterium]
MTGVGTNVGCDLVLDVGEPSTIVLSIAPAASAGILDVEQLMTSCNGEVRDLVIRRVPSDHGALLHVVQLPVARIEIHYEAHVSPVHPGAPGMAASDEAEVLAYRRPSRYCPSDRLAGFASAELGHLTRGRDQLDGLVVWVARRLAYVSGSSGPLDTAVETLLAGQGVCRDYAHLVVAMCRALDMPARCASVYAPGLWPMDFHAVAEVFIDGKWNVVDATYLAPRQSLVRIATGRDAADTSFLTTIDGDVELLEVDVRASTDGELPRDIPTEPVFLR